LCTTALFQLARPAYVSSISDIEKVLKVNIDAGLAQVEAKRRSDIHGVNELEGGGPVRSLLYHVILPRSFRNFMF
jgi:hypothetical protein